MTEEKILLSEAMFRELSLVNAMVVEKNGSVLVANYTPPVLLRVDSGGGRPRTVGGQGDGPGEYRRIASLGLSGEGGFWLFDRSVGKVHHYSSNGLPLRTATLRSRPFGSDGNKRNWILQPMDLFADGTVLFQSRLVPDLPDVAPGQLAMIRGDSLGRDVDTIAVLGRPIMRVLDGGRRGPQVVASPFQYLSIVDVAADGRSYVVVEQSEPTSKEPVQVTVTKRSLDGRVLFSVGVPLAPVPIPDSVRKARLASSGQSPGSPGDRELRAMVEANKYLTLVVRAFLARDGAVWMMRASVNPRLQQWLVLDPDGKLSAQISITDGAQPQEADGDSVWAVRYDADEIPTIVRYRMVR